jgi:hypothetical protein
MQRFALAAPVYDAASPAYDAEIIVEYLGDYKALVHTRQLASHVALCTAWIDRFG